MPLFRKKPVVIEAIQFKGSDYAIEDIEYATDFDDWIVSNQGDRKCRYVGRNMVIPTLEGDHIAIPGDWIIRGVQGELYPCKPDIFEETYDPA